MTTLIRTFGGNIGIGTDDPGDYNLHVSGGIRLNSLEVPGGVTIPAGLIGLWYGSASEVPDGWDICDGALPGGPDLTDRIPRCVTSNATLGQSGGTNFTTMSNATMAPHSHPAGSNATNCPHYHNAQTAYAGHGHYTQNSGNHTHQLYGVSWRSLNNYDNYNVPGGGYAIQATIYLQEQAGVLSNGDHTHSTGFVNIPHAHNSQANNVPHGHGVQTGNNYNPQGVVAARVESPVHFLWYIKKRA